MIPEFRIGLLRLVDSASAVLAEADGLFAAEGVAVRLSIEPSWANIADKLSYGALDAAVILPPLAIAIAAGLRGPTRRLATADQSHASARRARDLAPGRAGTETVNAAIGQGRRGRLGRQLARPDGLALPEAATAAVFAGPDRPVFAAGAAAVPFVSHAAWFAAQMRRWGWLEGDMPPLYRPDLFDLAARAVGLPAPVAAAKPEGGHATAWTLAGRDGPIAMLPDCFCDGRAFDENGTELP